MPKLIIDGREIEVPQGTKVIEAAERLGIMIPRFCYHPGLGSFGACRMCAVNFVDGPVKGVQMSCMTEARDSMVISTTDAESVDFRRYVIELLMLNHPHDCPVCDEGGHCLLQDETEASGHAHRRYKGKKRTHRDQRLGPFIRHEMNRCIHCYRCSNFYQEFAGYRDYGPMQLGSRVYFGRHSEGMLESPFSGNIIDLCPTGVLTDKPSRFTLRRWHTQRGPSLCIHCSLGCNTVGNAAFREILRVEANRNNSVNGYFICDRGRYGFQYGALPERPRSARIGHAKTSRAKAVRAATERLSEVSAKKAGAVACLGSPRGSLETLAVLTHIAGASGWRGPVFFGEAEMQRKVALAASKLEQSVAVSMREVEHADFILALGVDPVNEAPMLALAMRQAFRNGAPIVVIDPRAVALPFDFEHIPSAPADMHLVANALVGQAVDPGEIAQAAASLAALRRGPGSGPFPAPPKESLEPAMRRFHETTGEDLARLSPALRDQLRIPAQKLKNAKNPVIICGSEIAGEAAIRSAADQALFLRGAKERAGLFYVLPGANAFAAGLLASLGNGGFPAIVEGIEKGDVKALVVVECDPLRSFPDRPRLAAALAKLDLLITLDYLPSETAGLAHIHLPTTTIHETGGCFANQEGRVQSAEPLYSGGMPVRQETGGEHPPRLFRDAIAGGEPDAAWKLLADIGANLPPIPAPSDGDALSVSLPPSAGDIPTAHPSLGEEAPEGISSIPPCSPHAIGAGGAIQGGEIEIFRGVWESLARVNPVFGRIRHEAPPPRNDKAAYPYDRFLSEIPVHLGSLVGETAPADIFAPVPATLPQPKAEDGFELYLVDWTFGTEELSSHSPVIHEAENEPRLSMHPDDAARLGLSSGDCVTIRQKKGSLTVALALSENMARSVLTLPRHHKIPWQNFEGSRIALSPEQIQRVDLDAQRL